MVHRSLDPLVYARAMAILEAIIWTNDGDDIPNAIELIFLANPDNWAAAHGDPNAIAARWALRHYTEQGIAQP